VTVHTAIGLIPKAQAAHMNLLLAMIAGEPLSSQNLGRLCNATGTYPENDDPYDHATHMLGAWSTITPERVAILQSLTSDLPAPSGGWPLMDGSTAVLTEEQAEDAVAAFILSVTTQAEGDPLTLIHVNLNSVLTANGLKLLD
jgi:hypothetical protein